MHMKVLFLSLGFWSLTAGAALATTYCAVLPWGKSCGFKSYEECHRAAGNDGGCEFSPEPDQPPPANAPYCLVDQVGMQCIYESAPACRMAASIQNSRIVTGAQCIENPNR